ncbi:MAG: hypothetical protein J6Z06_02095 [Lachnospiraceae bacterium]|nr:hypothetical protein [Lachnospiraceae bacterium]
MNRNRILLFFMNLLASLGRVPKLRADKNYAKNRQAILSRIPVGFIEDQRNWKSVRFGFWNMAFSGCEIFAVYNAMVALEQRFGAEVLAEDIRYFERHGAMLHGGFGLSPYAIEAYFRKEGYMVSTTNRGERAVIRRMEKEGETFILTAYNHKRNLFQQIHTVCITKDEKGGFLMHNNYVKNSHGKYIAKHFDTLDAAVNGLTVDSTMIYLISIAKS